MNQSENYENEENYESEENYEDSEETLENSSGEPLLSDEDISLNVSCEIASVTMSLNQITKLKIGDIIEFIPWPSQVKLSLNGNYFAQGELVEINGMLGVKISSR